MSPEQARGLPLDARSDIFSLGTVLYELFTGRHPFPGGSQADVVSSILREEPAPITQRVPELPKQLEKIVEKLLRKDRDHRYQDLKDLKLDLEDLRDEIRLESKNSHPKHLNTDHSIEPNKETAIRSAFTSSIVVKRRFTLLHAIVFSLLAIASFVGLWFLVEWLYPPPPEPGSYPTTEIAIWSSSAGDLTEEARFSPDGKLIAFSSTRTGSSDIWVAQTVSPNSIQITNDQPSNFNPIWSPKGDEIAFFSSRERQAGDNRRQTGIWRVPALGGTARLVGTTPRSNPRLVNWSASGRLYFEVDGNLYSMEITSGAVVQLTSFEENRFRIIGVADDEKNIAYLLEENENWTIFTSDLVSANPVAVMSGRGDIGNIVWTRDRSAFFYSAKVSGVRQIFRAKVASGSPIRITASETDCNIEDVSPDGRSLIMGSAKEESDLWRVSIDGIELPVSKDIDKELWPSVSPDSKRVVYQAIRTMVKGDKLLEMPIVVKDTNSGTSVKPRTVAESGFLPFWSPAGDKIAFLRKKAVDSDLFVVNTDSGDAPKPVSTGISMVGYSVTPYNILHATAFSWSPSGSEIAYPSDKSGVSNIWRIDPNTGSDQQLTGNTDRNTVFFSPIWSRDGKKLAFLYSKNSDKRGQRSTKGISVFHVATGQTEHIFSTQAYCRLLGWSADERNLLVAEGEKEFAGEHQRVVISSIAVADGTTASISTLPNAYYFNIAVSPDGSTIAYAARENGIDDIWSVPAKGGMPKKLTNNNDPQLFFSRLAWQPDGNAIIFGKQTRFSLLSLITGIG